MPTSTTAWRSAGRSRRMAPATPFLALIVARRWIFRPSATVTARIVVDFPNEPTTATIRTVRTNVRRWKVARLSRIGQACPFRPDKSVNRPTGVRRSEGISFQLRRIVSLLHPANARLAYSDNPRSILTSLPQWSPLLIDQTNASTQRDSAGRSRDTQQLDTCC